MAFNRPTESELEILHLLWEFGPSSVRDINDNLNAKREVGYTTTLKLMQIMNDKGLVKRDTTAKSHIYIPIIEEKATKAGLLSDFVNTAFQGSSMGLVMQALGNSTSTQDELNELKALINQIENSNNHDTDQ
jgi:BlaI family penicillinase repressor